MKATVFAVLGLFLLSPQSSFGQGALHVLIKQLNQVNQQIHDFQLDHGSIHVTWQTMPTQFHSPVFLVSAASEDGGGAGVQVNVQAVPTQNSGYQVSVSVTLHFKNAHPKGGARGDPETLTFHSFDEILASPYISESVKNEIRGTYVPRFNTLVSELKTIEGSTKAKMANRKGSEATLKQEIKANIQAPIQKALMGIPNMTVISDL